MSKVLIVDDDVDLAELVKTKLASEGHQTFVIHTGEGAFEYAKQVKPDICLLDIMLPGLTGYQICRKFRKDPELYKLAILILTALGEEPEILHGLEQGADDYLVKPFQLEKLMDKIASMNGLMAAVYSRNQTTRLPGTDAIKREINHQLARNTALALIYIDVVGFKGYCTARPPEVQRQALEWMAKLLYGLTRELGIYECYIAHMGGEHFVVLLKLEDYERFNEALINGFDEQVKGLYSPQEIEQGHIVAQDRQGRSTRVPIMALSVGVAHTQYRHFKSAKKMFEVLGQVRQKAQPESGKSVIFVDRRRTDR